MSDVIEFVQMMKQSALNAVDAAKPVTILFGRVVETAPLSIQTEQKLTLSGEQLILSRAVTDYECKAHINWEIPDGTLSGERVLKVKQALQVGDTVLLLRMQGGQRFVVLDRVSA